MDCSNTNISNFIKTVNKITKKEIFTVLKCNYCKSIKPLNGWYNGWYNKLYNNNNPYIRYCSEKCYKNIK